MGKFVTWCQPGWQSLCSSLVMPHAFSRNAAVIAYITHIQLDWLLWALLWAPLGQGAFGSPRLCALQTPLPRIVACSFVRALHSCPEPPLPSLRAEQCPAVLQAVPLRPRQLEQKGKRGQVGSNRAVGRQSCRRPTGRLPPPGCGSCCEAFAMAIPLLLFMA